MRIIIMTTLGETVEVCKAHVDAVLQQSSFYLNTSLQLATNKQNVYTSPEVVFRSSCIYLLCIVQILRKLIVYIHVFALYLYI